MSEHRWQDGRVEFFCTQGWYVAARPLAGGFGVRLLRPEAPDLYYDGTGPSLGAAFDNVVTKLFPGGPPPVETQPEVRRRQRQVRLGDRHGRPDDPVYLARVQRARDELEARNLLQRQLCFALNVTSSNVSYALTGRRHLPGLLARIESYLGIAT